MTEHTLVFCQSCGLATTKLEAEARLFNTGRCGRCGGELSSTVAKEPEPNRTMTRENF